MTRTPDLQTSPETPPYIQHAQIAKNKQSLEDQQATRKRRVKITRNNASLRGRQSSKRNVRIVRKKTASRAPNIHHYKPRGVFTELFTCKDPEVLVSGPAGTGKSRAAMEKLNLQALKYPGMRGLIVRKTLTSLASSGLVTWRTWVIPEFLENGTVRYYGGSASEPAQYIYSNGSRIVIGGMDKATRIMSTEYDVIYAQEAIDFTVNDWEMLNTRLRHGKMPYQQLLADCNPDAPTHWLRHRAISEGKLRMLESKHEDNPLWFDEDGKVTKAGKAYIERLENNTGVRRERLRYGRWVAAEGIIYEDWDSSIHIVDRFEIPDDWPRFWGVDFGTKHPFVLQRWAEDPDGRLFLYAETYMTNRTVHQHAKDLLGRITDAEGNWKEPMPQAVLCDHNADGRMVLEQVLGLSTVNAHKAVLEGIQAVQQRLKLAVDDKPRLFILRDSIEEVDQELKDASKPTCTAEEIPGYVWGKDASTTTGPKEAPLKEEDDGCDAMRYVVADRDLGGRPNIRWIG